MNFTSIQRDFSTPRPACQVRGLGWTTRVDGGSVVALRGSTPMKFKLTLAIAILAILLILGYGPIKIRSPRPPAPETTHWASSVFIGDELYCDTDGREAASIIDGQVCVFKGDEGHGCQYFEHNSQALRYAVEHARCGSESGSENKK